MTEHYAWLAWADGKDHRLVRGQDFRGRPENFIRTAQMKAAEIGCRAIITIEDDVVTIRLIQLQAVGG